ncbi:basic membrane protein-domain-containing protein, partial [Blastocladiella britannica]
MISPPRIIILTITVLWLSVFLASGLTVRIVRNTVGTSLDLSSTGACAAIAVQNSSVTCQASIVDDTNLTPDQLLAAWDNLLRSNNDDMIIGMSFMYATPINTLAPKYPRKVFVIYDSAVNPPIDNVLGLTFAEDQSGFLAGALAGMFTTTKKVGVIGGLAIPPVKRFVNGYLNGVLSLCPTCDIYRIFEPSFVDTSLGQHAATVLMSKGADVLFGAGGSMGSGGILYAAQQNAFVIGVDVDESLTTFAGQSSGQYLLASAMKNAGVAITSAIQAVQAGAKGGYNMLLDASLNGVSLSSPLVSNAVKNFTSSVQVSIKTSG